MARTFLLLLFVGAMPSGVSDMARAQTEKELVAKGQYIFAVAGGCACHSAPKETPNTGGRAFPIPLGTVYSTNITQDKETGLGNWTDHRFAMPWLEASGMIAAESYPSRPRRLFRDGSRRSQSAYRIPPNLETREEGNTPPKNLGHFCAQLGDTRLPNDLWPIRQFTALGTEEWNR